VDAGCEWRGRVNATTIGHGIIITVRDGTLDACKGGLEIARIRLCSLRVLSSLSFSCFSLSSTKCSYNKGFDLLCSVIL
jgi:hypothetical protein